MKKFVLTAALLVSAAALAIQSMDVNISTRLSHLTAGLLIGPKSVNGTDAKINANRITRSLATSATINIAALAAAGCNESAATTLYGAQLGDSCGVGAPVLLAGDAGVLQGSLSCFVSAADAVKLRFCSAMGEDPPSASFEFRVVSNN